MKGKRVFLIMRVSRRRRARRPEAKETTKPMMLGVSRDWSKEAMSGRETTKAAMIAGIPRRKESSKAR